MFSNKRKSDVIHQPRSFHRRGSHSTAATVVLAAILAVTLLGAQILVSVKSVPIQARKNAADLIRKVSDEGLDTYLGRQPIKHYFLLEMENKAIGFTAIFIEPIQQDRSIIYQGKELYHNLQESVLVEVSYQVFNDLSSYRYHEERQYLKAGIFEKSQHKYAGGLLQVSYYDSLRKKPLTALEKVTQGNFIPVPFLDLFSSLSVGWKDGKAGMVFALADSEVFRGSSDSLFVECRVKPGSKVSKQIRALSPNGNSVKVKWLESSRRQSIYYSQDNQLIWQKDYGDSQEFYIRNVPRSQLVEVFPQADTELNNWFGAERNDNNWEVL